jgi:hypothetical protein
MITAAAPASPRFRQLLPGCYASTHSLLSVTTVTSNDAIKVTIYNCRK